MRNAAGFTLIEVLVAMTVMAVMAMMAWQGVDGIVRARDANQSRLEQTLRLNSVILPSIVARMNSRRTHE